MKLKSKILSLILALSMVLSMSAFALEFPDVTSENKNAEAIDVLSSLGIIRGYDDGTYKPEKEVTRAEMTSLLLRMLALSVISSTPVETVFTDVDPANWAAQDIKTATDNGYVKGYGEGLFGPDDNVTVEQAVKMIVEALGYGHDIVLGEGDNWAVNYMGKAREIRLLEGVTTGQKEKAPRGVVAQLLYNALEIDLMKPITGSENKYEINRGKTFLSENLKIRKIEGMIVANPSTSLAGSTSAVLADEVVLKSGVEEIRLKVGNFEKAKGMLGMNVVVYEVDDENKENRVIQHIMNKSASVTTLTIAAEDIVNANGTNITYYKDGNESREYNAKIATNPVVIYNGKDVAYSYAVANNLFKPTMGSVELTDSGSGYDLVKINEYENIIVNTVDSSNYKILAVAPAAYKTAGYNLPINDIDYSITIKKGEADSTFSAIRKNQVLSVKKSIGTDPTIIEVLISDETVTGQITGIDDDKYTINNKQYKLAPSLKNDPNLQSDIVSKIVYGASAKFYLDAFGQIAYADFSASTTESNYKYAYIIDAMVSKKADDAVIMQVYDGSSKRITTLTLSDKVMIDGSSESDGAAIIAALAASAKNTNYDLQAEGTFVNDADPTKATKSQLIRYQTNSSGKVNEIGTIGKSIKAEITYNASNYTAGAGATYTSGTRTFAIDRSTTVNIGTKTKLFFVPADRTEEDFYSLKTYSGLQNSKKYQIETFDNDTSKNPAYAVVYVTAQADPVVYNSPTYVISAINEVMVDGERKQQLTGYLLNSSATEKVYTLENNADAAKLAIGDVIRFTLNAKEEIASSTLYKYVDINDAIANKIPNTVSSGVDFEDPSEYPLQEVYMTVSLSSPYISAGASSFGINKYCGTSNGSGNYAFVYATPVEKNITEDSKLMQLSSKHPTESDFVTDKLDADGNPEKDAEGNNVKIVNPEYIANINLAASTGSTTISMPVIVYDSTKTGTNVLEVIAADNKEATLQSVKTYDEYQSKDIDSMFVIMVNSIVRGAYIIKR